MMRERDSTIGLGPPEADLDDEPWPTPAPWWSKPALLLLTVALFTLSFAPFGQFYLAWFALVPWLVMLGRCRSAVTAFCWSWLGGVAFFVANMWWLAYVTGPGMLALMAVLGLYWSVAGAIIRGAGLVGTPRRTARPIGPAAALASVLLIAAVWVGVTEWFRGTWPLGGLAWLYLGHTQSPLLVMCQVADVAGVFGISFWVALINAWVALLVLRRTTWARLMPAGAAVALVLVVTGAYGAFRLGQHTTRPGPVVLVVQPNYPQSNSGEKGAPIEQIVRFHLDQTRAALAEHPDANLVVWSETMMPPLNPGARAFARGRLIELLWDGTHQQIAQLARQHHVAILAGGVDYDQWMDGPDGPVPQDRRNSAFLYLPTGPSDLRYDKIHLVPFGEFLPFKSTIPPLYRLFLSMSPYSEEYTLTAGAPDALTVFTLPGGTRFVSPICFEDIDAPLVQRMFEPGESGGKRADLLVNITNDGWFKVNEMPQHLQAAVFRSIENRVPSARSVNTGISGFIDSVGHTHELVTAGTSGYSVARVALDDRLTIYTRVGDVFAQACAAVAALLALMAAARGWRGRRDRLRGTPIEDE